LLRSVGGAFNTVHASSGEFKNVFLLLIGVVDLCVLGVGLKKRQEVMIDDEVAEGSGVSLALVGGLGL
jgi:hypothetical protein